MAVTLGSTVRTLTRPLPLSLLALVIGAIVLFLGVQAGQEANALFVRTENVLATVDMNDRLLHFTTWSGEDVATPLITDCKQRERPPRNTCISLFETGDEVLISYDREEPRHVWVGETPGGGRAALMTAVGITLLIAGTLGLWWTLIQPRLSALFSPVAETLPRQQRSGDKKD